MRLLKLNLLLIFVTLSIGSAVAGENLRLGIVATPQLSWLKSDDKNTTNEGLRPGFNFGMIADSYFAKNYAFSTGLIINHLAGKLSHTGSNEIDRFNLSYIELPIGIKLRTNEFRRNTYFAQFGLNPMINIKAQDGNNTNISKDIALLNMAYHIGGGLEYSIGGNTTITAGVIYKTGFVDVTKNRNSSTEKTILNSFCLQLGIIF